MAVANAGFGVVGTVEKLGVDDYRRQFDTNVFGVLETIKACLPELRKTRGRLVLIGSVAATFDAALVAVLDEQVRGPRAGGGARPRARA